MKVSLVIPNWNGAEKLKKNLPKVLEVARAERIEEIIVSDDASKDNSVKILKSEFPEVVVLESKAARNLGFSSNVNRGVKQSKGDLVMLLNTDATLSENFLKPLLPHFENSKVFGVGCNTGGTWATATFKDGFFQHSQAFQTTSGEAKAHITLWASGGSGVFRKSIWEELGGLDPLYNPFYVEDLDLGYRAWKRGYKNIWEPRSLVKHYKEKGVIESNFSEHLIKNITERNMLIFTWKNITSKKLMAEHKKALVKMFLQHPKYSLIIIAALRKLSQILARRKIEERDAKLADEEILYIFALE